MTSNKAIIVLLLTVTVGIVSSKTCTSWKSCNVRGEDNPCFIGNFQDRPRPLFTSVYCDPITSQCECKTQCSRNSTCANDPAAVQDCSIFLGAAVPYCNTSVPYSGYNERTPFVPSQSLDRYASSPYCTCIPGCYNPSTCPDCDGNFSPTCAGGTTEKQGTCGCAPKQCSATSQCTGQCSGTQKPFCVNGTCQCVVEEYCNEISDCTHLTCTDQRTKKICYARQYNGIHAPNTCDCIRQDFCQVNKDCKGQGCYIENGLTELIARYVGGGSCCLQNCPGSNLPSDYGTCGCSYGTPITGSCPNGDNGWVDKSLISACNP